jgi:putative tryptophan/tyrosine transport system substrate-binding protein
MNKRDFITLLGSAAAAWPLGAPAQSTMPVIGYLHARGPDDAGHLAAAFRRGLRDGGFIDGKDVRVEYRWASGQYDQLPGLAKELVGLPVSVLAASGGESCTSVRGPAQVIPPFVQAGEC